MSRKKSSNLKSLFAKITAYGLGYLIGVFIVCFPTVLVLIGISWIGFDFNWSSWSTYAGIMVLAVGQLAIKMVLSDVREGGKVIDAIFTFPKK